jgi:hypothetical protein
VPDVAATAGELNQVKSLVAQQDHRLRLAPRARDLEQDPGCIAHRSIQTTNRYLGSELDLALAACDRLGIRLDSTGA